MDLLVIKLRRKKLYKPIFKRWVKDMYRHKMYIGSSQKKK